MKSYTFGIVSEGPTDFQLMTSIIAKLVPGEHRYRLIQPDLSETPGLGAPSGVRHSNGWRGVLSWCEAATTGISIYELMEGTSIDVLIIQADAEIAREPELDCARPCPEAEDTVIVLEGIIREKLNIEAFDSRIICCIPSDNTEAWVLVALDDELMHHGADKFIECVHKPDEIVSKPPFNAIGRKAGKAKKRQSEYRDKCVPPVVEKWDYVRSHCHQAEKFHKSIVQL
ncbi:hypothetical protein [Cohnella hongkongensis]|uniref:DUF4276 family protein n=1 Tax=Cohnella hongkongensis TaxID=178337 RepID=A0ABV9FK18_9BACL